MSARRIALALSLLVAAGCTAESAGDGAWAGSVERDGETVVVRNPAAPLVPDSLARVERLWTVPGGGAMPTASLPGGGASEDVTTGAPEWAEASDVVVVGSSAFLLDRQSARIHQVSLDGRWRGSFGRAGGGPGELRRPERLTALGDTLVVLDAGDPSLELFDTTGAHRRQIRLQSGVPFSALPLGTDAMLVSVFDGSHGGWLRLSRDGATRPFPMPDEGGAAGEATPSERPCHRTATAGADVLRLDCAIPRLAIIDSSGAERLRVAIPRDSAIATAAELAAHRSHMLETMAKSGLPSEMAVTVADQTLESMRVRRPFRAVRRDASSGIYGIWEQGSRGLEDEDEDPAMLHLLTPEGVYLARIQFGEPWRDFTFVEGGVLTLSVDEETGLVSVERYRITLPDDAIMRATRLAADDR